MDARVFSAAITFNGIIYTVIGCMTEKMRENNLKYCLSHTVQRQYVLDSDAGEYDTFLKTELPKLFFQLMKHHTRTTANTFFLPGVPLDVTEQVQTPLCFALTPSRRLRDTLSPLDQYIWSSWTPHEPELVQYKLVFPNNTIKIFWDTCDITTNSYYERLEYFYKNALPRILANFPEEKATHTARPWLSLQGGSGVFASRKVLRNITPLEIDMTKDPYWNQLLQSVSPELIENAVRVDWSITWLQNTYVMREHVTDAITDLNNLNYYAWHNIIPQFFRLTTWDRCDRRRNDKLFYLSPLERLERRRVKSVDGKIRIVKHSINLDVMCPYHPLTARGVLLNWVPGKIMHGLEDCDTAKTNWIVWHISYNNAEWEVKTNLPERMKIYCHHTSNIDIVSHPMWKDHFLRHVLPSVLTNPIPLVTKTANCISITVPLEQLFWNLPEHYVLHMCNWEPCAPDHMKQAILYGKDAYRYFRIDIASNIVYFCVLQKDVASTIVEKDIAVTFLAEFKKYNDAHHCPNKILCVFDSTVVTFYRSISPKWASELSKYLGAPWVHIKYADYTIQEQTRCSVLALQVTQSDDKRTLYVCENAPASWPSELHPGSYCPDELQLLRLKVISLTEPVQMFQVGGSYFTISGVNDLTVMSATKHYHFRI